jgi:hypothetical protein
MCNDLGNKKYMKINKYKTTITISEVAIEFVWDMDVFLGHEKKFKRKYYENDLIDTQVSRITL